MINGIALISAGAQRFALAVALTVPLAACPGQNLPGLVAAAAPAALSPQTIATMQTWCSRGAPLIQIAQGQNIIPAGKEIAGFVGPFCASLAAGQVPPSADVHSADWLASNIVGLARSLGFSL